MMILPTTTPAPYLTSSMLVSIGAAALLLAASGIRASPQVTGNPYQFAADTELYLESPLDTSFTCDGLDYGFYADTNNNCQVFHVCQPVENDAGEIIEYNQWSFICGNTTIFDQSTLTCNHALDAFPCADAPQLYGAVEFGKVDYE
jgi:hypothetical protein